MAHYRHRLFRVLAALPLLAGCSGGGGASPAGSATIPLPVATAATTPTAAPSLSRVTSVTTTVQPLGTFAGVAYARTLGIVGGVVDAREAIVGLAALAAGAPSVTYTAEFEIVAPAAGQTPTDAVLVDAENRGSPLGFNSLNEVGIAGAPSTVTYPAGLGNAFLQRHATSYARVQWQTGIASGVPATAQGVGLAIERDFARLLLGRTNVSALPALPARFGHAMFVGISQSAWLVNDFIAEGFNVDPVTGQRVFDAAIAIDGTGNWLAVNALGAAAGVPQTPYLAPNGVPLTQSALLTRPATDPFYVDVANSTDFYRLRASVSEAVPSALARRYDWPSPHAAASYPTDPGMFASGCNGGTPMTLNPIGYAPYLRALVLATERQIGVSSAQSAPALPPSTTFALAPAPASPLVNALPGVALAVPQVDANAIPVGGVRFADSDVPLGRPEPPAIGPVTTSSISATCGNLGGFAPFSSTQLAALYGSESAYLAAYDAAVQRSIAAGFVLSEDERGMLARAKSLYEALGGPP